MCHNTNNIYFKFAIITLIATILGIVSGIIWPSFFTSPGRLFFIELVASTIAMVELTFSLIFSAEPQTRNCQAYANLKPILKFLLFGTIGSFVIATIGLSTTLPTTLLGSIIIGIAVGFFALMLGAVIITIDYLIKNLI